MKRLLMFSTLIACAPVAAAPRGPVVTEVRRQEALCFDRKQTLRVGQEIDLQRQVCRPLTPKTTLRTCKTEPTGTARVEQVLDAWCVVVSVTADSQVSMGDELAAAR